MTNAFSTHFVSKHFNGIAAVDNVSIDIPTGRTTGLVGPNGSGKTTLFNLISGLFSMDKGWVTFGEKKHSRIAPTDLHDLSITRTFQDCRLINQMSVADNIRLSQAPREPLKALAQSKSKATDTKSILTQIGLEHKACNLAEDLSYGQRKLLEIGRTIASDADVYLLDEPFSGLFPETIEKIVAVLEELQKVGKTLVVIDHNIGLIRRICDHVIVMDAGKVLTQGKPAKVFADKKVKEAYLGG